MYPSRAIDPRHPAVPASIAEDWEEAQKCIQVSAIKAAAVMARRVLYGVLQDRKCKLAPLHEGIKQLQTDERLPAMFDKWLPAIKDDGHDAAHPDRALSVDPQNIEETMGYTSELLKVVYIQPYDFQERQKRIAAASSSTQKP